MTADEQIILQTYLLRIAVISSEDEFEEWYRHRHESEEAEAEYKAILDLANAYALGLRDAKLQAEAWVEGIDRTYNLILRNTTKEIMEERHKPVGSESTGSPPAWLYLPIGPEGPRPWPVG